VVDLGLDFKADIPAMTRTAVQGYRSFAWRNPPA